MDIRHDSDRKRFESDHDEPGYVAYRERGNGILELTSTQVPSDLEGKGVGSKLAKEALDYARAHDFKVVPTCPFIRGYIERHPEYQDIVAQ